jgi:hypothetical protein
LNSSWVIVSSPTFATAPGGTSFPQAEMAAVEKPATTSASIVLVMIRAKAVAKGSER